MVTSHYAYTVPLNASWFSPQTVKLPWDNFLSFSTTAVFCSWRELFIKPILDPDPGIHPTALIDPDPGIHPTALIDPDPGIHPTALIDPDPGIDPSTLIPRDNDLILSQGVDLSVILDIDPDL